MRVVVVERKESLLSTLLKAVLLTLVILFLLAYARVLGLIALAVAGTAFIYSVTRRAVGRRRGREEDYELYRTSRRSRGGEERREYSTESLRRRVTVPFLRPLKFTKLYRVEGKTVLYVPEPRAHVGLLVRNLELTAVAVLKVFTSELLTPEDLAKISLTTGCDVEVRYGLEVEEWSEEKVPVLSHLILVKTRKVTPLITPHLVSELFTKVGVCISSLTAHIKSKDPEAEVYPVPVVDLVRYLVG